MIAWTNTAASKNFYRLSLVALPFPPLMPGQSATMIATRHQLLRMATSAPAEASAMLHHGELRQRFLSDAM
jgi:hypothetical protein